MVAVRHTRMLIFYSGPAGLTAAICTARDKLTRIVIEGMKSVWFNRRARINLAPFITDREELQLDPPPYGGVYRYCRHHQRRQT